MAAEIIPEQPANARQERAWWAFRARLASSLWAAFAEARMSVQEAAEAAGMKERSVWAMLRGDDEGVDTGDVFRVFHALGFRVLPQLQEEVGDGQ